MLKGLIVKTGIREVAKLLNISITELNDKINEPMTFTIEESDKLLKILDISHKELMHYIFKN